MDFELLILTVIENFFTNFDADGKSRRLIARIFVAILFGLLTFYFLNINVHFLLWLILCSMNNLIALSNAPKDYLLKYYFVNLAMTLLMLLSAMFVNSNSPYFIAIIALLGFVAGLTSGLGQSGKMIGALAFVLFSVTSFINVEQLEIPTVLTTFAISNFWTLIVMFVFIPIPKSKILKANTKLAFKALLSIIQKHNGYDTIKATEIMRSIKDDVCSRLPNECLKLSEKFITLKNLTILMTKYDTTIYANDLYFNKIYSEFKLLSETFETLLELSIKELNLEEDLKIFLNQKQKLNLAIQNAFESEAFDNKQIAHMATASYISFELGRIMETLNDK